MTAGVRKLKAGSHTLVSTGRDLHGTMLPPSQQRRYGALDRAAPAMGCNYPAPDTKDGRCATPKAASEPGIDQDGGCSSCQSRFVCILGAAATPARVASIGSANQARLSRLRLALMLAYAKTGSWAT